MVELLKSGRINNRLLCEIATHKNFTALMTDAEIYVDGIATMRFQDINASLEAVRAEIPAGGGRYNTESIAGFADTGRRLFLPCHP